MVFSARGKSPHRPPCPAGSSRPGLTGPGSLPSSGLRERLRCSFQFWRHLCKLGDQENLFENSDVNDGSQTTAWKSGGMHLPGRGNRICEGTDPEDGVRSAHSSVLTGRTGGPSWNQRRAWAMQGLVGSLGSLPEPWGSRGGTHRAKVRCPWALGGRRPQLPEPYGRSCCPV